MGFYRFLNYLVSGKSGFVFEILVCEILFDRFLKPRKWPYLTIPAAIAAHLVIGLLMPGIPAGKFSAILTTLVIFAVSVLLQWGVTDASFHQIVFHSVAAYAVQSFALNARETVLILTELSGWSALALKYLFDAAVFAAAYFLFVRREKNSEFRINYIYVYVISLLTLIVTNVLFSVFAVNIGRRWETKLVLCICCLLTLMLQYSVLRGGVSDYETAVMKQLLRMEQKQHALSQENIDIINIKCHDLKRQIALLRQMVGEDADELVRDVEKAVLIYDSSVDTGNKNLDLVINEEKLFCNRHNIRLDIMADGAALDFMEPSDIYSLFGNALRNAVESVLNEEEGFRLIELDVHRAGEYVAIGIKNFCSRQITLKNGRPLTSKQDARFHGYGIRSMEYIVERYSGNMVIDWRENTFLVKIIIRLPK